MSAPQRIAEGDKPIRIRVDPMNPVDFARARLALLSDALLGIAIGAKGALAKPQKPLRELRLSDAERIEIATILRCLAKSPALDQITARRRGRGSPPDRAKGLRDYKMVLDYQEHLKFEKANVAQQMVAEAWGVRRTALMDANQKLRNSRHWKAWARLVRRHVKSKHKSAKDLPQKISLFLRNPANLRELPGHDKTGLL